MRAIFIVISFIMVTGVMFAQGNLQFNQVVNYTINTPFGSGLSRPNETLVVTVPAGKVVKIESAHLSCQSNSSIYYIIGNSSSPTGHLVLNGAIIACFDNAARVHEGPIWLTAGTHTFFLQGFFNSSSQYRWNAFVSGIEFDVVP